MHGDFIFGADFSSLEETESLGGRFFDKKGESDAVGLLASYGINCARLRLWVDPYSRKAHMPYGGGTCDIGCVKRLAARAKEYGMSIMLDIHYSDFWADPQRQLVPKSWAGLSFDELCRAVRKYTFDVITEMKNEGLEPQFVQIGNEITNGLLWPYCKLTHSADTMEEEYDRLARALSCGVRGARESTDAKLILHLESSGNTPLWDEWLSNVTHRSVDFDIIGASYYPFWHGSPEGLKKNLDFIADKYKKEIIVVETGYPFTGKLFSADTPQAALVISDIMPMHDGTQPPFPFTRKGQADFISSLLELVRSVKGGQGVCFWEPTWLGLNGSTWATEAALSDIGETEKRTGNEWSNQCLFDYTGEALPALSEFLEASRTF